MSPSRLPPPSATELTDGPSPAARSATAAVTILDIEASGFGAGGYPIEIGYVRDDGCSWCSLIRPEPEWTRWDASAQQVHGITRVQVESQGRPAREIAQRLNTDLAGRTAYSDAWAHDYAWLAQLFDAAGLAPRFRLESIHRLIDADQLPALADHRRSAFDTLQVRRHRASSDARALQWALLQVQQQAGTDPESRPSAATAERPTRDGPGDPTAGG
ncbi:MAG: hypothetical protein RL223_3049 [Pseudomonadota bacterium]|jgi:hypothetical protein